MISDKILDIDIKKENGTIVRVPMEWFETEKKRIKKLAEDGTEIGICIEDNLHDGDVIARREGKFYVVDIIPSKVVKVTASTMEEMGRLGFELGNRHLSLKITGNQVLVPYDEPTFLYLKKLGFHAEETVEKLSDFIVCKAHGHSDGHSHAHTHAEKHSHSDLHGGGHHHVHE